MTDLPTLTGRPTDVDVAATDRDTMLAKLAEQITTTAGDIPAAVLADLIALYREVALRHTDARWWLLNVTYPLGRIVRREFTAVDEARLDALRTRR